MKEKLAENTHKGPITTMVLVEAIERMKIELWELLEELNKEEWDYVAIRRELADVMNYAGAGVVDCDRVIAISKIINDDLPRP
jgi:NTP pyrophosphatase (non-canonical NTP hydrolase)